MAYSAAMLCRSVPFLLLSLYSVSAIWSKPTVRVHSPLSRRPNPLAVIGLTAVPKEEGEPMKVGNNLRYRFSVSVDGSPFRIVRDYSSRSVFAWRPELYDHEARVKVAVLNIESKETGEVELPFRVTSRVVDQSLWRLSTANRSSRCSALLRVLTVASFVWLSNGERFDGSAHWTRALPGPPQQQYVCRGYAIGFRIHAALGSGYRRHRSVRSGRAVSDRHCGW